MPRLLLIEDNFHMQRIYAAKFQLEGFEVITANNGEQGLKCAAESLPDAIILDIMLPRMDGFEVLRQLKDNHKLRDIPVFMLTNKAWADDVQRAMSLGAREFYPKGSATLQNMVMHIRRDCGFQKLLIIANTADSARSLTGLLKHPRLLCASCTVLVDISAAIERGAPNLILFDSRKMLINAPMILQTLTASPLTASLPVISITDEPQRCLRATKCLSTGQLAGQLRPTVLRLLGLMPATETDVNRAIALGNTICLKYQV